MGKELPQLTVAGASAWRQWLAANHGDAAGVWLVLAKKDTTEPTSLTYDQALEEALCHGWIDGQTRRRDDATYAHRFTPRRKRGQWSKRNVGIVERLAAAGRMHSAGLAEVERAKADGRWQNAYAGQAQIQLPADLRAALDSNPAALAAFATLTSQNRYAVIHRVESLRRADSRARRIEQYVAMLARGESLHPQPRRA
ncbi:MAG TPA: YdeI/OmpD-associated family protein [Solirubrobacteraceae bacterium]|nr:YdeI/OmpD-associated family protein [Solirubrobacteraceae bacterium]